MGKKIWHDACVEDSLFFIEAKLFSEVEKNKIIEFYVAAYTAKEAITKAEQHIEEWPVLGSKNFEIISIKNVSTDCFVIY